MLKKSLVVLFASIIVVASTQIRPSCAANGDGESCPGTSVFDPNAATDDFAIELESHTLSELVDTDPGKNLAVLHPGIVMNAAQRDYSHLIAGGHKVITDPLVGFGNVDYYPALSEPLALNSGRYIVGQHRELATFVQHYRRAAEGDGASSKMLLLEGPPGTGKSDLLNILINTEQNLERGNPDYFLYSYEFVGLGQIPELTPYLTRLPGSDGRMVERPEPCPIHESPIVLLPKQLQDQVISMATERAVKISTVRPTPQRHICPFCNKIRNGILKHYARLEGKATLTAEEQVRFLDKHVVVRRHVRGMDGRVPKIDPQGRDVDYDGLFSRPRPAVMMLLGPGDPASYFLNGAVIGANGGTIYLDEFYRNDRALLNMFLGLSEDKKISRGGAPTTHLDAMFVAADNTETINAAKADPKDRASLDRTLRVQFKWSRYPHLIAQTMLLMKGPGKVLAEKLETGSPEAVDATPSSRGPIQLNELFPLRSGNEPFQGPDGRYNIWIASAPEPVHIAPHTIMFMAEVVAATRLNFDAKAALEKAPTSSALIGSSLFTDLTARLQVLTGEREIPAAQMHELNDLSILLGEGMTGMTQRDAANVWLTQAVAEAQKPENGNCLTPQIAMATLSRLLQDGTITHPNNQTRLEWLNYAEAISKSRLIPQIQSDINSALSNGVTIAQSIYDEVWAEMVALSQDEKAKDYGPQKKKINRDRYNSILGIYQEVNRRPLAISDVSMFLATTPRPDNGTVRYKPLLDAINTYVARRAKDLMPIATIIESMSIGEGSGEVGEKRQNVAHVLQHQLGYCQHCMKAALEAAHQEDTRKTQAGK